MIQTAFANRADKVADRERYLGTTRNKACGHPAVEIGGETGRRDAEYDE